MVVVRAYFLNNISTGLQAVKVYLSVFVRGVGADVGGVKIDLKGRVGNGFAVLAVLLDYL